MDQDHAGQRAEEISAVVEEIRRRVRTRNPNGAVLGDIPLADLIPLSQARDSAEGKVASIGTVNPRSGGVVNSIVQRLKRLIARSLNWHVREQVNFNRAVLGCVQATMDALNESNRAIVAVSAKIDNLDQRWQKHSAEITTQVAGEVQELKDIRTHWSTWRETWERKLSDNEIHFFRSLSDLQASFSQRTTVLEENHQRSLSSQHRDFENALAQAIGEIQRLMWADMVKIRGEYDELIHSELRLVRQRLSFSRPEVAPPVSLPPLPQIDWIKIDWMKFTGRFRGSEADIQQRQQMYATRFHDSKHVLDIGCGRGELLRVLTDAGVGVRGIDLSEECVALCRAKGLDAETADLFAYLDALPPSHLDGIVCCQVVEHLPPERLPELVRLCAAKLKAGALLALETPNPECLAIFATHFYLDPTH
ncbi:MAG TPA: methyltransferase domain-containing protein, partial [Bryobacteraceae bacterium]|nr:methyltransferase domain-containing protein [Bryobacteraceae bacterium]